MIRASLKHQVTPVRPFGYQPLTIGIPILSPWEWRVERIKPPIIFSPSDAKFINNLNQGILAMLTDITIKQFIPDLSKTRKLFDGGRNGLHILCYPSGRKVFAIKYAHPVTKKDQTLTIGEYPYISLKTARDRAETVREMRANGVDPREADLLKKVAARAASHDIFEQLTIDWIAVRGARWSASYRHKIHTMLARHLFPAIGKSAITQITAPKLLSLLRPIENSGRTDLAHTLLQQVAAIFRFAIASGRAVNDPSAALKDALAPHRQNSFASITDPEQFAELLTAMDGYQGEYITKAALEFTMLTFQRSLSIRLARWDQIDWSNQLWRIPAEAMKMREPHLVPLSTQAVTVLKKLHPLTGDSDFIFPCLLSRRKPISENTMLYALVRLGYRGRMTVHGFRTSASTLLNEQGFNPDAIEAALAHVRGDIRSIYNRAKYLPERTKMYQWWADYCDRLRRNTAVNERSINTLSEVVIANSSYPRLITV
jgi:integrase